MTTRITEMLLDICGAETCEETGLIMQLEKVFSKLPIHNEQPGSVPEPLDDRRDYSNDDLSSLLLSYCAWGQYWGQEHAVASVAHSLAKARLTREIAAQRNSFREQIEEARLAETKPSMAKGDINDAVSSSDIVQSMQDEMTALSALRETMESQQRTYDKYSAAVSRVIEVRRMEFDMHQREGRATSKRSTRSRVGASLSRSKDKA